MDEATKRLVIAGAVGHLCMYRYNYGRKGRDWFDVAAYASRTFPDAGPAVIAELIDACVEACESVAYYHDKLRVKSCGESADSSLSSG